MISTKPNFAQLGPLQKLLGGAPTFRDLHEVQPSLARGLEQLLTFEGDVENVFCRWEPTHHVLKRQHGHAALALPS